MRQANCRGGKPCQQIVESAHRHLAVFFCVLLLAPGRAFSQATVSSAAAITNVPRGGVNISQEVYWESAVGSNIFANPGFEFPQYGQVITVSNASNSTVTSEQNSGDGPNSWQNGECSVRVGVCSDGSNNYCWNNTTSASTGGCTRGTCDAGSTFTIAASSTSSGRDVFTCSGACPTLKAPAPGPLGGNLADVVGCRVTGKYDSAMNNSGWGNSKASTIFVTSAKAFQGNSSVEFNNASSGQTLYQEWDGQDTSNTLGPTTCVNHPVDICTTNNECPSGDTCSTVPEALQHPVVGAWQFSFYALTAASGAACSASFGREGYTPDFKDQSFALSADGAWHQYTYNFTGQDTAKTSTSALLTFTMGCTGGVIYVDNMFLGKATGASGAFSGAVVSILQGLKAGSVREMDPGTVSAAGPTALQAIGTRYTMPPAGDSVSAGPGNESLYSFHELAELAAAVSPATSPFMTIPIGWSDADYTTFGKDLCSLEASYNFPAIWVECGNENWNGGSDGLNKVPSAFGYAYGATCARDFQVLTNACADSHLHYLLNNQTGNGGVIQAYLAGANYNLPNTPQYGASEHMYSQVNLVAGESVSNAISATMTANETGAGLASGLLPAFNQSSGDPNYICLDSSGSRTLNPCNRSLAAYEWSVEDGKGGSSGPALLASQVNAGWGGAGIAMQTLLLALTIPNPAQAVSTTNLFQLVEPTYGGTLQWSGVAGYAGTNEEFASAWPRLRPLALGLELYNNAASGDFHPCTGAPSGILCAAFYNSSSNSYQVAIANTNQSATPVTITFPTGAVVPAGGETVLYTYSMADNNENSNSVAIGGLPGGTSRSGQQVSFTAPALSAMALLNSTTPSPNPTPTRSSTPTPASTPSPIPTATPAPRKIKLLPASLTFGNVEYSTVGSGSQVKRLAIINPRLYKSPTTLQSISAPSGFTVDPACNKQVLAPGQQIICSITYTPTAPGLVTGALAVITDYGPQGVPLIANGIQRPLALYPRSLDFGSAIVAAARGGSSVKKLTIFNRNRKARAAVYSIAVPAGFAVDQSCNNAILEPRQSIECDVTYTPTSPSAVSGVLTVSNSGKENPQIIALRASGATHGSMVTPIVRNAAPAAAPNLDAALTPTSSAPVASIDSTPTILNVQRAGLDLGQETYAGPSWFRSNVLENPGFEPLESGRVLDVASPTSNTFCETGNSYLSPPDFYKGAPFEVVYSANPVNIGTTGTITAYDPSGAGCNGNPQWSYTAKITIAPDDIVVTHASGMPRSAAQGCSSGAACGPVPLWSFANDPQWTTSTDNEPNGKGSQSLQLDLDGNSHNFDFRFDRFLLHGHAYFLINGAWSFSIYSKAVNAGGPVCRATLSRNGGPTYFSTTWVPGTSWTQAKVSFNGGDTISSATGEANLSITCTGSSGAIRLDDAYLGPATSDGVWRSPTVNALRQLKPGYLRDNQSSQGADYADLVSNSTARQPTSFSGDSNAGYIYSIPEFFYLNSLVGSRPWVVLPVDLLDSEYAALGKELATLQATYKFPQVILEFGNNNSDSFCGGVCFEQNGSASQAAYAYVAGRAFGLIQKAAGSDAHLNYVGGARLGTNPPGGSNAQYIASLLPRAQYIGVAPRWDRCQNIGNSTEINEENLWNDPSDGTSQSMMESLVSDVREYGAKLAFAGIAPSTLGGSDTTSGRTAIVAGGGSAGAEAQMILRAFSAGVPLMSSSQFTQLEMPAVSGYYGCGESPKGATVPLAGMVSFIDTPVFRPRGLALQLLNNYAIGGDFYPISGAPSGVTMGGFLQSDGWHLALTNSTSITANVFVRFPNATAALPAALQQIDFSAVTDSNEDNQSPKVSIGSGGTVTAISPTEVMIAVPAYSTAVAHP